MDPSGHRYEGERVMTERYTAVLDRIVDGETAVLLLEDEGDIVDQLDLAVEELPEEGAFEGAVFEVEIDEGAVVSIEFRMERTERRLERARERFERLSRRLSEE